MEEIFGDFPKKKSDFIRGVLAVVLVIIFAGYLLEDVVLEV